MAQDTPDPCTAVRAPGAAPPGSAVTPAADGIDRCTDTVAPSRRGGLYEGRDSVYRVRLFVEIDFARGTRRVSGDFFRGEPTAQHVGWFHLPAPRIETTAGEIEIKGFGRFTFAALAPVVVLRLARSARPGQPDRVSLSFLHPDLACGAHYLCAANAAPDSGPTGAGVDGHRVVALADRQQRRRR